MVGRLSHINVNLGDMILDTKLIYKILSQTDTGAFFLHNPNYPPIAHGAWMTKH